jgi:flagellar biosynthetic protein FliQ
MEAGDALDLAQSAIWVVIVSCGPIVIATMIVGVAIALLQALTQVQEVTLTFVPKIVVVLVMLALTASFIGSQIWIFSSEVYQRIERTGH